MKNLNLKKKKEKKKRKKKKYNLSKGIIKISGTTKRKIIKTK